MTDSVARCAKVVMLAVNVWLRTMARSWKVRTHAGVIEIGFSRGTMWCWTRHISLELDTAHSGECLHIVVYLEKV